MRTDLWTAGEVALFEQGLTIKEIAEKTGRTYRAVEKKRYMLGLQGCDTSKVFFVRERPIMYLTQIEKEERLKFLMNRYGVRLGGDRK